MDLNQPSSITPGSPAYRLSTLIIRPPRKWVPVDLRELWAYRELITSFTLRDIKLRYKQIGLGIAWALLQPLLILTMLIFTVIFGWLAKIPSDGVPYPLFVLAALLPWMLFAEGLTRSTTSMVMNANIMTKVYFPRLIMPLSSIISPRVDFAVPFLIQIWMFASLVVNSSSLVPESLRLVFGLNPMTGVIEGFRGALLGSGTPTAMVLVSVGMVALLLITGMFYFRRMEQYYSDIV